MDINVQPTVDVAHFKSIQVWYCYYFHEIQDSFLIIIILNSYIICYCCVCICFMYLINDIHSIITLSTAVWRRNRLPSSLAIGQQSMMWEVVTVRSRLLVSSTVTLGSTNSSVETTGIREGSVGCCIKCIHCVHVFVLCAITDQWIYWVLALTPGFHQLGMNLSHMYTVSGKK